MTFISYAQNYEDLMLHRALGDIENGFYVDVGAQHAVQDSVTATFYQRGWRGINIDPIRKWARLLARVRPRDINLQLAIDADRPELIVHEVEGGLSTVVDAYADGYRTEGRQVRERRVAAARLDDVLEKYAEREIHFLKIDVEGAERSVLESLSLDRFRPWIILIEATRPGTPEIVSHEWESLVLAADYALVYWDGLNKFYLAKEHASRRSAFDRPPNVFDSFQLAATIRTHNRLMRKLDIASRKRSVSSSLLEQTKQTLDAAMHERAGLDRQLRDLQAWNSDLVQQGRRALMLKQRQADEIARLGAQAGRVGMLQQELAALQGSFSWLVTAPIRLASRVLRREIGVGDAISRAVRGSVRVVWLRVRLRTAAAQRLQRAAAVHRGLYQWLQRAATRGEPASTSDIPLQNLSARARLVLGRLAAQTRSERG